MKIKINRKPRGIVLAVTLGIVLVFAIILVAYESLVNNQNSAVARSQGWNQAIPVLETGIEEGLTQLYLYHTNSILLTNNSWTYGADGLFHKSRTNSDGSYYTASIQITNDPIIISTGFVPVLGISTNVTRRVRVIAKGQGSTPGGLNAKGTISFTGAGSLDSFNSSNPLYSSNGQYVASMHESNGLALTDSDANPAISVGTGTIYGSATTGPTGTVTVGSSGQVTGTIANDANVQFNDVSAPFVYGTGTPVPISSSTTYTYGGTNYSWALLSGNYDMASLTISSSGAGGNGSMVVEGNCTLYVNGPMTVQGSGYIYIAPGGSLTMYVNGTATISGSGVVNGTQLASQCAIYGMPGCDTFTYSGSATYIGTVYAPDTAFTYSGSADASGSFTAETILISGSGSVHYDEALGAPLTYVVASWNEF